MTEDGRPIEASAKGQHGYFTRRQAKAGGVSHAMLRSRVQSGDLVKAGVRTYTSPLLPTTVLGELSALMLDIREPIWAFGATAAALHGFDGFKLAPPFHLVTERDRNVRRVGHVIHTALDLPPLDRETASGIAVTSPTRTIIDLAKREPAKRLTSAIDSALRDGLTSENFLHGRISALRSSGRYGIPRLLAAIEGEEITRGAHSWLERRFLEVVAGAGLPRPETQAELSRRRDRLIRVDCRFVGSNVVVELLGYRWHRTKDQMQRDAERANRLILDGFVVLQFTYSDVAERPEVVVEQLCEALGLAQPKSA
jgi:Transcriptional regulator, AbiEi antitoxin/Protein of unknown function (DUF559)